MGLVQLFEQAPLFLLPAFGLRRFQLAGSRRLQFGPQLFQLPLQSLALVLPGRPPLVQLRGRFRPQLLDQPDGIRRQVLVGARLVEGQAVLQRVDLDLQFQALPFPRFLLLFQAGIHQGFIALQGLGLAFQIGGLQQQPLNLPVPFRPFLGKLLLLGGAFLFGARDRVAQPGDLLEMALLLSIVSALQLRMLLLQVSPMLGHLGQIGFEPLLLGEHGLAGLIGGGLLAEDGGLQLAVLGLLLGQFHLNSGQSIPQGPIGQQKNDDAARRQPGDDPDDQIHDVRHGSQSAYLAYILARARSPQRNPYASTAAPTPIAAAQPAAKKMRRCTSRLAVDQSC